MQEEMTRLRMAAAGEDGLADHIHEISVGK